MTSEANDLNGRNTEEERELALVASRLLGTVPPRTPGTSPATGSCGWCATGEVGRSRLGEDGPQRVAGQGEQDDPAAWVLHVLREHVRDLLAPSQVRVRFNAAGGATVEVFDAYVEDVALIRDTLGVEMLGVLSLSHAKGCAVIFGGDPYARQVSMVWHTWPRFLHLADQLTSALWSLGRPPATGTTEATGEPS